MPPRREGWKRGGAGRREKPQACQAGFGDDLREWLPVIARPQAGREVYCRTRNVCEAAPGDARAGVGDTRRSRMARSGTHVPRRLPALAFAGLLVVSACNSIQHARPARAQRPAQHRRRCRPAAPVAGQFCAGNEDHLLPRRGPPAVASRRSSTTVPRLPRRPLDRRLRTSGSDWDPNKMITSSSSQSPRSAGSRSWSPGDDAFDPLIAGRGEAGHLVTVMNTELPKAEAQFGSAAWGTSARVLHDAGASLPTRRSSAAPSVGVEVMVWGLKAQPGRGERPWDHRHAHGGRQ